MWHNQLHIKKTARCVSFSSSSCFPLLEKAAVVECRCCGLGNGEFQSFYYTLDELTEGFGATGLLVFTSAHGRSLPLQVKINKKKIIMGKGAVSVRPHLCKMSNPWRPEVAWRAEGNRGVDGYCGVSVKCFIFRCWCQRIYGLYCRTSLLLTWVSGGFLPFVSTSYLSLLLFSGKRAAASPDMVLSTLRLQVHDPGRPSVAPWSGFSCKDREHTVVFNTSLPPAM